MCVCVFAWAHPTRHCSAIPFSLWHAAAFTNPHCRTEQAWLCIQIRGERQTSSKRERKAERTPERERKREREREWSCNAEMQRARDEREEAPLSLSPSLLVFTSAVSLSSRPAEWVTALQFIQRDSPSQAFPAEGEGGGGVWRVEAASCRRLAVRWCSRGSQLCLDNGIDCF